VLITKPTTQPAPAADQEAQAGEQASPEPNEACRAKNQLRITAQVLDIGQIGFVVFTGKDPTDVLNAKCSLDDWRNGDRLQYRK